VGNPWRALTLEWQTSSPPPVENWPGEPPLILEPYAYGHNKPVGELAIAESAAS
jgi:cytochrome c oxidase subunit I